MVLDFESSSAGNLIRRQRPRRPEIIEQPATSADAQSEIDRALEQLGQALDEAAARDRVGLAAQLLTDPVRADLRALMGQLGFPKVLRLLDRLMRAGLPENESVLSAVLEPDATGIGQYLQAALAEAARRNLLERIYAPERLAALMAACEPADQLRAVA